MNLYWKLVMCSGLCKMCKIKINKQALFLMMLIGEGNEYAVCILGWGYPRLPFFHQTHLLHMTKVLHLTLGTLPFSYQVCICVCLCMCLNGFECAQRQKWGCKISWYFHQVWFFPCSFFIHTYSLGISENVWYFSGILVISPDAKTACVWKCMYPDEDSWGLKALAKQMHFKCALCKACGALFMFKPPKSQHE